jgi:VWFA-related protein
MSRTLRLLGIIMLGVATLVAGASAYRASPPSQQDPPQTFRASADVVSVEASVRRDRRPVTGLMAGDFEIRDNGVPQEISTLSYEKLPIDVTIVLDVSASVTGVVLDQLRRSVRQLRTDLGPRDRLKLVTFNMRIRRLADFTDPASTGDTGFAAATGYGSSAIFDTLAVTLTKATPPGRRSLIVLFSDGQDSSSISSPDALLEVARRSTPTVAIVLASALPQRPASVFAPPPASTAVTIGRLYDQIATETGGVVVATVAGDNLSSTFKRVLDEFRATYVLYFTPRGVDRAGSHTLDVRVKRDGVDVHARRGYVWQ